MIKLRGMINKRIEGIIIKVRKNKKKGRIIIKKENNRKTQQK